MDLLERLWADGDHILAAVSGGADSVALLLLLHERAQRGEITLSAAHLNHGIRGEEADRDERFVRELCERLCVPLAVGHEDVPALAERDRIGMESAARIARHGFLAQTMANLGADSIAYAHHMDDQAETVLMHMLRGAGLAGAAGMDAVSCREIRPLLHVTRAQIIEYLDKTGQDYVTDSTNLARDNPRNRIRHSAMPVLESIYPGAVKALCRFADIQREAAAWIARVGEDWLERHVDPLPFGFRLLGDAGADPALVRWAIRKLLQHHEDIGYEHVDSLVRLYFAGKGRRSMPGGYHGERAGRWLYLARAQRPPPEAPLQNGAALERLCSIRMKRSKPVIIRDDPWRQVLGKAALEGAMLRTRRSGDRFQMMNGPDKLLSDVLIDRKVDRPVRDWIPLIAKGERVLWIPGVGVSEQARLRQGDEPVLLEYEGYKLP